MFQLDVTVAYVQLQCVIIALWHERDKLPQSHKMRHLIARRQFWQRHYGRQQNAHWTVLYLTLSNCQTQVYISLKQTNTGDSTTNKNWQNIEVKRNVRWAHYRILDGRYANGRRLNFRTEKSTMRHRINNASCSIKIIRMNTIGTSLLSVLKNSLKQY